VANDLNPSEALKTIIDAKTSGEKLLDKQLRLAEYAGDILARKGELVMATRIMYGGTNGRIGSANSGTLLTRATMPVAIRDSYIAIRDYPEYQHQSSIIELLLMIQGDPAHIRRIDSSYHKDKILARLEPRLVIPGVRLIEEGHIEAIDALLHYVDDAIEPLDNPLQGLPRLAEREDGAFIRDGFENPINQRTTPITPPNLYA
jgi:hypothetical protein